MGHDFLALKNLGGGQPKIVTAFQIGTIEGVALGSGETLGNPVYDLRTRGVRLSQIVLFSLHIQSCISAAFDSTDLSPDGPINMDSLEYTTKMNHPGRCISLLLVYHALMLECSANHFARGTRISYQSFPV